MPTYMTNNTILKKKVIYFGSCMETEGTKRNKRTSNVSTEMDFSVTEME